MIENIDILFNVTGQTLYFDCPEGRPSSVTSSQVFENIDGDDATAETAVSGTGTIETNPNTTFDAASGDGQSDPHTCNLTATTGIAVGRRYLLTTADGETEWAEVREISSGASVRVRTPLKNAYAAADTFESTRITDTIDSTWVADTNNISPASPGPRYRWRLEYVVDSVTYVHAIYFDLVRYSGTSTVTGLDVDRAYPWLGFLQMLPTYDQEDRGARVIAEAYRQVKLDLAEASKADQAARNREVLEDLVVHKAAMLATRDPDAVELIEKNYQRRFNNFVAFSKEALPFDKDGSGAARRADNAPLFRR